MEAEIAIIGGTGVYDPQLLEGIRKIEVKTPFGDPSDEITLGTFKGRKVAVLPRHGKDHTIPPHKINYRANIYALKSLGVHRVLSPCAVGSLQEHLKPGDFVFADQFIDRTHGRPMTFHENGKVCHISVAEPFCPELRKMLSSLSKSLALNHHSQGTYICIEGPRFSTRAESMLYRAWGDIIGMTLVPEAVLAREAEMCYVPIAMVTDWDVWKDSPVTIEDVLRTVNANEDRLKYLLEHTVPEIPKVRICECKDALKKAFV